MRIVLCFIALVFFWAWCSILAPEAWTAAHIVWTTSEAIVITKSKLILYLFLLGVFGIVGAAFGLWISCEDRKL
jgi:hypothetical protein